MRLQIVDDHVLFREGLAAIIRSEADIEIVGLLGTVREAVESARSLRPDVILMDFALPDGTGLDATRAILAEHPTCKVIFLTMSEEDDHLMAAISAGAKGYLLKNMRPAQLLASLRSVYNGEGALAGSMTLRLMEKLSQSPPPQPLVLDPEEDRFELLTSRELEVLRVLASGKSNQEIGQYLFISENTVRYHIHSILAKLNLPNRTEAARFAHRQGLVP